MRWSLWGLALFCALGNALVTDEETSVTIEVNAAATDCFHFPVNKQEYSAIELNYLVLKGGERDIDFIVRSPAGVEIHRQSRSVSHSHRINIDPATGLGDYTLCLDNSFSYVSSKTVSLSVYLIDAQGNYAGDLNRFESSPAMELLVAAQVFESTTSRIKSNLNRIEGEIDRIRTISYLDRSKSEDNFELVNFWGVVNTIVMMVAGGVQVILIRSLLTENSKLGKLMRGSSRNSY